MYTIKITLALLAMLVGAGTAKAGSTDGLNIAVVAADSALPYASSFKRFLVDYSADGVKCGEYALRLENVYVTDLPKQLNSALALGAVKNSGKRKKLSKILTSFRDNKLKHGFDGALTYEVIDGQLRFHGISGAADEKVVVSNLAVDVAKDQKKFNVAACKALASLPVLVEP